jgi:hypothetical protein
MRRRCTCGAVDVASWHWCRAVFTSTGLHHFDGVECQLGDEALAAPDDPELDERARQLYDEEAMEGDKPWEELGEQARDLWRLHIAGRAGL